MLDIVKIVETSDDWIKQIPNIINEWRKCILK